MRMSSAGSQDLLKRYTYSDLAKRDINDAMRGFSSLKMQTENFIFNDGTSRLLVKLQGVLPVTYKGNVYNFPVDIYFLETHPYNPPIVYVRPTSTMIIKANKHVDSNGQVYHPYISEWTHPRSDTKTLLRQLQNVFGETPPLYARSTPANDRPAAQPTNNHTTPNPYPAVNSGPGYPISSNPAMPQPYSYSSGGYMAGGGSAWNNTSAGSNYPYQPYMPAGNSQYPVSSGLSGSNYNSATVNEDHLRASVLSAIEDKVRAHLRDMEGANSAEMETMLTNQKELTQNENKIRDYLRKADAEKMEVSKAIDDLKRSNEEMEKTLQELQSHDTLDIDEAFDATAPLFKQMLAAFAEEQAISDAIYFLGEALGKDVIDVELFLKKVRLLSRKQFMLRATVQKCRSTAGLPSN